MKRERILKWLGFFFGAMVLLTMLSRAADSMNTAQVSVKTMQNQVITHRVSGTGKVEGTRERAVFVKEGQRVEQVMVQTGQSVKKGETILKLSEQTLMDSIKEKERELEELHLKEDDLKSVVSADETKKNLEKKRANEDYDTAISNGDVDIYNAQTALDQAQQRLSEYYDSLGFTSGEENGSEELALKSEIRARQEALNQAILSKNQAVREALRSMEDANLPKATDGTLLNVQRQIEDTQEELEELQILLEQRGEITAPADGVIKSMTAEAGSLTSGEAPVILYELGGELRMTASVSKDDIKYVEIGAAAQIRGSSGKETENGKIESIRENETDPDRRILTILIPENTLSVGESADFTISKDEGPFASCVPLSALYGESGREYVFVLDTENSVLGDVQVVHRVEVTVEDKNESLAALGNGVLSGDQQIVIETDRFIEDGSRVRLGEL